MPSAAHEAARGQNQCHAAVAQDGRTGNVGHLAVVGLQILDHYLVLAQQLIDQQRHTATIGLDHHHDGAAHTGVGPRHLEDFFQRQHGHVFVAHLDQLRTLRHGTDRVSGDLERLDHRRQGQDVYLVAHAHRHSIHDGQRQRQAHRHLHAEAL